MSAQLLLAVKLRSSVPLQQLSNRGNSTVEPRTRSKQSGWPIFRNFLTKATSAVQIEAPVHTPCKTTQIGDIVQDAKRFILYNRSIIEKAPLQAYVSALVFSPKMSLIRRQFLSQGPTWIKNWPDVEENWNLCLQTLEGHSDEVNAVTFSPDVRRIASAY
jgi:WD40 repeat protein